MFSAVENLYGALKNIDRSDIVKSLEDPVAQAIPEAGEEGASRLAERDSTLLSPSVVNGKTRLRSELIPHCSALYSVQCRSMALLLNQTCMCWVRICMGTRVPKHQGALSHLLVYLQKFVSLVYL